MLKVRDCDECRVCGLKDYKFQEKGVDVGLAVDIVKDVLSGDAERVIIVSSDTDLLPAIRIARQKRAEIVYIAFSNQITQSISRLSNNTIIFEDSDIVEAYRRANT
jgi:uncharacterized LabA/DUF88 family protein